MIPMPPTLMSPMGPPGPPRSQPQPQPPFPGYAPGGQAAQTQTQSKFLDANATRGRTPSLQSILPVLKPSLSQLLSQEVRSTVEIEKIWQYAQIRRMNLYLRGKQYIHLAPGTSPGVVDYRPISGSDTLGLADKSQSQYYDAVLNWLRGDIRAFVSVLGSRAPNIQALAKDVSDESLSKRIRIANRLAQYVRGHIDFDGLHRDLVHSLAVKGTTFAHTRYVSNPALYGYTSIPQYEWTTVPGGESFYQCWGCGNETPAALAQSLATPELPIPRCRVCGRPQDPASIVSPPPLPALTSTTPMQFANGALEITLMGADRMTIPFWIRTLRESPWACIEEEVHPGALIQALGADSRPEIQKMIGNYPRGATGASSEERGRYTRSLVSSPSGYVTVEHRQTRLTHTQLWYSPWTFEVLPGDQSGAFRELLYKLAPEGLKVQYVNGEPLHLSAAKLTRNISACKPEPSETLTGDPYFEDYIQAADTVNDLCNILIETGERAIPTIVFDPTVLHPDRIREFANLPGEYLPAQPNSSSDLSKAFFRAPAAELSPALVVFLEKFISWVRDISGITPTLWGGGGPEPTARAAELKKNQAMGRLNLVWNNVRQFESEVMDNSAYILAKYTDGRLFTTKADSSDSVEAINIPGIDEILRGGWRYWAEEAMPMTPGQRRDWYMNLFQMATANPLAMQLSGLGEPANLARWQETVGSADWRTPGLMEREGLMAILALIATQPPMASMGGIDPMTGQPLPPQPWSPMPVDQILLVYTPDLVIKVTREFLTSDKGRDVMEEDFQGGWQNLLLFLQTVLMISMPPPPPPGEDGEGEDGEGGEDPGGGGGDPNSAGGPGPAPSPTSDLSTPGGPGIAGQAMPGGSSNVPMAAAGGLAQ